MGMTTHKLVRAVCMAIVSCSIAALIAWYLFAALGFHIVHKPTADELFGCTVAQQTDDGECK